MFSSFFFPLSTYLVQITQNHVRKKQQQKKKKKKKKKRRNWNKLIINSVHHENIFYTSKYIQLSIELEESWHLI